MASWTDDATLIAALAAGKAFTDEKAQALAENPVALFEGATGAPRLDGKACTPPSLLSLAPVLTVSAADTYALEHNAGIFVVAGTLSAGLGTVVARTIVIQACITGVVRFRLNTTIAGGVSAMSVKLNGVVVNSWASAGSRVQDIAVVPGNTVTWEHSGNGTDQSIVSSAFETANTAYTRVAPLILASEF